MKRLVTWAAALAPVAFLSVALWPTPLSDPEQTESPGQQTFHEVIGYAWDVVMEARQWCPQCSETLDRAEQQLTEVEAQVTPDAPRSQGTGPKVRVK